MKILEFPKLRQTYEYDCGAVALQSVLAYFGIELRLGIISEELKTSKQGTCIQNIEDYTKKHKLKLDSKSMTIEDIKNYINKNIPIIVILQAHSKNKKVNWETDWKDGHYVIVIGYDNKKIYFADPSSFYQTYLTFEEFKKRWHDTDNRKKYINHGIAIYGKTPKFSSKKIIHMD